MTSLDAPARVAPGAGAAGPRVALLRHGRTAWNREGRVQGRRDIPMDAGGRAELLGRRPPPPWDRALLIASPLLRARETAEMLLAAMADDPLQAAPRARGVQLDPRLMEMDFGVWEGRTKTELRADPASGWREAPDWTPDLAPPGGETFAGLTERALAAVSDALDHAAEDALPEDAPPENALQEDAAPEGAAPEGAAPEGGLVILVCHFAVMRAVLAAAHGWDFQGLAPFEIRRRRLYPLRRAERGGGVVPAGPPIKLARMVSADATTDREGAACAP